MIQSYTVNGDARPWRAGTTVDAIVTDAGIDGRWVAVAVDGVVVPSSRWPDTAVPPGSAVDILQPCQGG